MNSENSCDEQIENDQERQSDKPPKIVSSKGKHDTPPLVGVSGAKPAKVLGGSLVSPVHLSAERASHEEPRHAAENAETDIVAKGKPFTKDRARSRQKAKDGAIRVRRKLLHDEYSWLLRNRGN